MKKPLPHFTTDEEAEAFVATADLTEYDLSGLTHVQTLSEDNYERLLAEVEALMDRDEDSLSPEENAHLDQLADFIERYEEYRWPIRK